MNQQFACGSAIVLWASLGAMSCSNTTGSGVPRNQEETNSGAVGPAPTQGQSTASAAGTEETSSAEADDIALAVIAPDALQQELQARHGKVVLLDMWATW
jgi:thiol:disulfide interchange protein